MNLSTSTDSQVDFEIHTDEGDDDDDNAANNMAQYDDVGDQHSELAAAIGVNMS